MTMYTSITKFATDKKKQPIKVIPAITKPPETKKKAAADDFVRMRLTKDFLDDDLGAKPKAAPKKTNDDLFADFDDDMVQVSLSRNLTTRRQ